MCQLVDESEQKSSEYDRDIVDDIVKTKKTSDVWMIFGDHLTVTRS